MDKRAFLPAGRWLRRSLIDASRWTFLLGLIFAPWAYGGTTPESVVAINWVLGSALVLWGIGWLFPREERAAGISDSGHRRSPLLVIASIGILIWGWWMVFNAKAIYDSPYAVFVPLPQFSPGMPGSIDFAISAAWMVRGTLLLGAIWFVAELSRDPRWLLRLWWTLVLAGGSIATLGLLQKATGAEMIFWQAASTPIMTFFATYYYHANAGAFLNLTLPAAAGMTLRVFSGPANPFARAVSLSVFVILIVAIFANTSRVAQCIGAVLLLTLLVRFAPAIFRRLSRTERNLGLAGIVAVLLALYAVGQASHLELSLLRWQSLGEQLPRDARWLAAKSALAALPETGLFGTGPGTFRVVFPRYATELTAGGHWVWRFLHEDYLQTLMEWGWAGATLWAFVLIGGIVAGIRSMHRQGKFRRAASAVAGRRRSLDARSRQALSPTRAGECELTPRQRLLLPLSILALIGVAVHALVDFPLQIASIQLHAATFLGICWGSAKWSNRAVKK